MNGYRRSYVEEIVFTLLAIVLFSLASIVRADDRVSIQMVTRPNCVYCERWKAEAKPKLAKVMHVKAARYQEPNEILKAFPAFYVFANGKRAEVFYGYPGLEKHKAAIRKALESLGESPPFLVCHRQPRPYQRQQVPLFRAPIREAIWRFLQPAGYAQLCPRCGRYHR